MRWKSVGTKGTTNTSCRVRTLTGKEIELDIENDYKVLLRPMPLLIGIMGWF
jgi:hypothetical protein